MIEVYGQNKTIKQLYNGRNELNTELAIQRASDLWSEETKSSLIHSILYGFPIPSIWIINDDNSLIDGKQRTFTIFSYIDNKFALSNDIEDVDNQKISGLTFSQLPQNFQDRIFDYSLTITYLKNITEQEVENFFQKINNGLSLSKIEITRTLASTEIMKFVQEIASQKFFSESIALTESNRKRFVDEELILQILALVINEDPVSLSGAEIRAFAKRLRHEGISEKHQKIMRETTEYLNKAIPDKMKELRKVHVPMVFLMAIQGLQNDVPYEKLGGLIQKFFSPKLYKVSAYKDYASSKTADKGNVAGRIYELQKFYDENIETAPIYRKPEPGQRGRKPRENNQPQQQTPPMNEFPSMSNQMLQAPKNEDEWKDEDIKQEFPHNETDPNKVLA
jgi:hypothetical protein